MSATWNVTSASIVGTSHLARGKGCQDACRVSELPSSRHNGLCLSLPVQMEQEVLRIQNMSRS